MAANEPQTCSGVGFFYPTGDVFMKFGQQRVYLLLFFIVLWNLKQKQNLKSKPGGRGPPGLCFLSSPELNDQEVKLPIC
jgi:hypothetical protein